jgi:hypothetical protein
MSRKKSVYKGGALLRQELFRQMPLRLLSLLVLLAAMPGYTFAVMQRWDGSQTEREMLEDVVRALYDNPCIIGVLGALAVVAAAVVFHYLHVRQQTEFYHALPIRRGKLFQKQCLAGILAVVPAYVIGLLLQCLLCAVKGYDACLIVVLLLQKALIELGLFAVVYAISAVACILCGGTLAALLVSLGMQVGGYALWKSVLILFQTFYPAHLLLIQNRDLRCLSPLLHHEEALRNLGSAADANGLTGMVSDGSIYQTESLLRISLAYLLAAVVLLALAALLYRRRRSERTGTAIVFRGLRLPIKYLAMTICGILFGWVLLSLTGVWIMLLVGMAAGILFAHCVIEVVLALELRAVFSHQLSLWLYLIAAAAAVGAMQLDVTQYNVTLPSRSDIVAADIFSQDGALTTREYDRSPDETMSQELLDEITDSLLTDSHNVDEIYSMAQRGVQSMRDQRQTIAGNTEYDVVFRLKDGSSFVRSFYLGSSEVSEEYNVLTKRAASVRFSEEYLQSRTPAARADSSAVETLLVENSSQAGCDGSLIEDSEAVTQILDTVREESLQLTADYVTEHPPILVLHTLGTGQWEARKAADSAPYSLSCGSDEEGNIPIYACEQETIQLLKEQGISVSRFTMSDIASITLSYYPDQAESSTLQSAIAAAEEDTTSGQTVTIAQTSQFDDILGGAAAEELLLLCDPIVQKNGTASLYDGYLDRTDGVIRYRYMKDMVPNGLQAYWN